MSPLRRLAARPLTALPVALALALAAVPAAPAHAAQQECQGATATPAPGATAAVDAATLCLINRERTERGLRPLRANRRLGRSATRYSGTMAAQHFFGHVSPGGSTMLARIKAVGYLSGARGYTVGENLAWGSGALATPQQTVRNWMGSPGHRANILNPSFRELGVGVALGAPVQLRGANLDGAATYTTHFGARS